MILDKFFLKYDRERGGQIDPHPPQEKATLKKPSLIRIKKTIPLKYSYFLLEHKLHSKQINILISDLVDILCTAESKLYKSFLNSEIALEGFKKPFRLDIIASKGDLLIYVKTWNYNKNTNNM